MGLSIRAYARHHRRVRCGGAQGHRCGTRITPEPDGTIDPSAADREWARNSLRRAMEASRAVKHLQMAESSVYPARVTGQRHFQQAALRCCRLFVPSTKCSRQNSKRVGLAEEGNWLTAPKPWRIFHLARIGRDAWLNWPARVSG